MKFDKSKVYTSVNADELNPGDKIIVANNIGQLIDKVEQDYPVLEINGHANGYKERRFLVNDGFSYALAYLVERKEKKSNKICVNCENFSSNYCNVNRGLYFRGYCNKHNRPTEYNNTCCDYCLKTGKHYRPFKDTDELIKVWFEKGGKWQKRELAMPYIWVKKHDDTDRGKLIISFSNNGCSVIDVDEIEVLLWEDLFNIYTFLDGSPCGVEE